MSETKATASAAAEKTGELTMKDDAWVPSTCYMCYNCCGIKVHRVNGVVVKIEGDPDNPANLGRICAKGNAGIMTLYDPYRVKKPLKRTNPEKGIGVDPRWVEISWDEALDTVAQRIKEVRADDPRKIVLASMDFGTSPVRLVAAALSSLGTPNWHLGGPSYFCGNALHNILCLTQGAFYVDVDLHHCNYCLLVGTESGFMKNSNATLLAQHMADARLRGMKVVVVDPLCTNAASKADEWVPIRPGTDAAFALAMANVLINELGIYDGGFLKRYTNAPYLVGPDGRYVRDKESGKPLMWDLGEGRVVPYDGESGENVALEGTYGLDGMEYRPALQLLKEHVQRYTPEEVSKITTIPAGTIRRIAKDFGEAARIGSKIVIGGKELPYRPAALNYNRGPQAHKHGFAAGLSLQLLNTLVGAIDVPGGILSCNTVGPNLWGDVTEGPDGLIVSPFTAFRIYPPRPVKRPQTLDYLELFPLAPYASPWFTVNMLNPEKYKLPYMPEILLHCRTNIVMTCGNPSEMEEAIKKIPFMVSFAHEIDETAELADIILPDADYLERLDMCTNVPTEMILAGYYHWYYLLRQPVVKTDGVPHWGESLLEIARRAGVGKELNSIWNVLLKLKDEHKLEPDQKYAWEEVADRWARSLFGDDHDLGWFKEHGFIQWPKKLEEGYPRPFLKARIPIYNEFFLQTGENVKQVTEEMGVPWDTSDYQPLPEWKPCRSYEEKSSEYDLYAINYKLSFHTFSTTVENPWLTDLADHHPYAFKLLINSEVAKKKGLRDDDVVWVETVYGYKVKGKLKVTECIHPEVIAMAGTFGAWARGKPIAKGKGINFNTLLTHDVDYVDMTSTAIDSCIKVKIYPER
ncbi:MAG: molybdopterin-dependent oxidoreductase [Chloroflexi bacterium]|nr:molybdopterin-dependent oxidoreductase [Chloroflexota bacterium]